MYTTPSRSSHSVVELMGSMKIKEKQTMVIYLLEFENVGLILLEYQQ